MKKLNLNSKKSQTDTKGFNSDYFLFFLLFLALAGCYNIIQPYLHTIIIAAILATIFSPVHRKIEKRFKGRKNAAAFLSCVLLTLIVVLPLFIMLLSVVQQGIYSFNAISKWAETFQMKTVIEHPLVIGLTDQFNGLWPDLKKVFPDIDLKNIKFDKIMLDFSATVGKLLIDQGKALAGNLTAIIGKFFLMIFTFFFFIRDEEKIIDYLLHLIPLSASQEERIISRIKAVSKSALLGTFVTAIAQGAAGGLAFFITGLPGIFWGMVMAFASLIPMVGTALIWVPAAFYLLISGHWWKAIFMVAWCGVIVGAIDNFVRPMFMQGSANMNTLLIFFSILGGIQYFGILGILYGPLVFGLAMVLLIIYDTEYGDFLNRQDKI